jgi:hypothetical protein
MLQQDGKFVVAGRAGVPGDYFALARYQRNGALDKDFGNNGRVLLRFFGASQVQAVANASA